MGNLQSRQHYQDIAEDALLTAQDLHNEISGPRTQGTFIAHLTGHIDAERMIRG